MGFTVYITSSAKKNAKRLPPKLRAEVIGYCENFIALHPFESEKLGPPLQECRSLHFKSGGVHYRIAYRIIEKEKRIDVVLIGSRENFYERLRQALRK